MIKKRQFGVRLGSIAGKLLNLRHNPVFNYVVLALLGILVGLISLLLGAVIYGKPMFMQYFDSFLVVLLNVLPPVLLIFLFYFIVGRAWIAFAIPTLITLSISMVHFFKYQIRGDVFLASDLAFIRETGSILSNYSLTMNWKILLAVSSFILGTLFCFFVLKHRIRKPKIRIITVIALIAVCSVLYASVYANADIYAVLTTGDRDDEVNENLRMWTLAGNYVAKGFLYPFIHSVYDAISSRAPDWFDEEEARRNLEAFTDAGIPEDKRVNIIAVMLEAYADISQFGVLDFQLDVYGSLRNLQAESVSGNIVTNVFAGGTIDTERLFLTGTTHLTDFRYETNSYVHYLRSQGYVTEGLHAGDKWFYDRELVMQNLGFDAYYFLEDFRDSTRWDSFFFPAMTEMYMARDRSRPYFGFNISYQNHGAYDSTQTWDQHVIAQGGMSDESFFILNNYLVGIHDTTERMVSFIDMLRDDPEPVAVLFFGDHMPWLGNLQSVYYELGINIDNSSEEGFFNTYSTPYLIWANDAAKERTGNDFVGDGGSFSPGFLMGKIFSLCNWEGEGYMQALRELKTDIDIIHAGAGKFRENGVLTNNLSPEGLASYRRLRSMDIYRIRNFMY